jgi:fructokinase
VVAFGEILVDQFYDREVTGGAPFNVACHLHAFGACPLLISRVGTDPTGDRLWDAVAARGMSTAGLQRDADHPTGRVRVVETDDGHRFDILGDQAYDYIETDSAYSVASALQPGVIYFGTLAQRGASRHALHRLLATTQATPILDVNLRDPWVDAEVLHASLQHARIVKLNEEELARIAALLALDGADSETQATALHAAFDLDYVVMTRGAGGAVMVGPSGAIDAVRGRPLAGLVDTVGAGDAFAAVFILGELHHWPAALRLSRADAFGRAICRIRGAVPATLDFYRPFRRDWRLDTPVETARA